MRAVSDDEYHSPSPNSMERVGKLMENYLAEIASDPNLMISRFTGLAELVPEQARITEDDMYRAIDIYLKVTVKRNFISYNNIMTSLIIIFLFFQSIHLMCLVCLRISM